MARFNVGILKKQKPTGNKKASKRVLEEVFCNQSIVNIRLMGALEYAILDEDKEWPAELMKLK
jgi:hypothetical protein